MKSASTLPGMLEMIEHAVVGYRHLCDVRLVVFPEFGHAAPIYDTVDKLIDRLAVPIPNEHTDRLSAQGPRIRRLSSKPARFSKSIRAGRAMFSTRPA